MQEEQLEKKQNLQSKYPEKKEHIEKLLFTCAKFENDTVWQQVYIELEEALENQNHHKILLLENMVRRMKTIHEEDQKPPPIKANRRKKILIVAMLIALFVLAFYLFKQS